MVVFLAALVLAISLPDLRRVWQPMGELGYVNHADGVITTVVPHSAADNAGLKVGDRIDLASAKRNSGFLVATGTTSLPGQRVIVPVKRGTKKLYLAMVSEPEPMNVAKKVLILSEEFALLLFVGIGAGLVLLRPSITTWAFYAYCLGLNPGPASLLPYLLRSPWDLVTAIGILNINVVGFLGLAVFAALFLHEENVGWRRLIYRFAPLALLVSCGLITYTYLSNFSNTAKIVIAVLIFFLLAVALLALFAFVETYVSARGTDRQRIRWVILGFGIALVALITLLILFNYQSNIPYWLFASLNLVNVVVPLTVAYAVIRHRVIDVSFVVSRAFVYAILTTFLVGALSVIDWLFIEKLKLVRLGTIAEVGAAVAAGFWFNGLHKRIDIFIDATFFRQRHAAERQLARIATALPFATTTKAVAQALVAEPVRMLLLASAAVFRRRTDGVYSREESVEWAATDVSRLDDEDDQILMLLRAENGILSLYEHQWRTEGVPTGPAHPVLALPIIVRRELTAIVFYGAHLHGEPLDPDEMKAIAGLATGAAAAYDHLQAEALHSKNESLQSEVESLRKRLAAQIQPA